MRVVHLSSTLWALGAMVVVACGGTSEGPETPEKHPVPEAPPAPPPTPDVPPLDAATLAEDPEHVALVPSPLETQKALEQSGIGKALRDLIPKHSFKMEKSDLDHAAIRTGVILADAMLTVKSAETPDLVARLKSIQQGMTQLGGGEDIDSTLKDMVARLESDAVHRDELLKEMDELSGAVIPELKFNGNDRVVPLIEAGSWLEGANLVARAIQDAGESAAAADTLLKQPAVVDYFLEYVREEGAEKAPEAVTQKLEESLLVLKGLATKAEPLTKEDVAQVVKVTTDVLGLL